MEGPTDSHEPVVLKLCRDDGLAESLLLTPLKFFSFVTGDYRLKILASTWVVEPAKHVKGGDCAMTFLVLATTTTWARFVATRLAHLFSFPDRQKGVFNLKHKIPAFGSAVAKATSNLDLIMIAFKPLNGLTLELTRHNQTTGCDSHFINIETKPLDSSTHKSLILLAPQMVPFGLLWTSAPP